MDRVVTDFQSMASGYGAFLFALGGVAITILTLVLALKEGKRDHRLYPALVAGLVMFALSCFVGAHLLIEAASWRGLGADGEQSVGLAVQRLFVIAEPNLFIAAVLFLFTLMLLTFTYESDAQLHRFSMWIAAVFMPTLYFWQYVSIAFIGIAVWPLAIVASIINLGGFIFGYRMSREGNFNMVILLPPLIATAATLVWLGMTQEQPGPVRAIDAAVMAVAASLGVSPITGQTLGIARYVKTTQSGEMNVTTP